MTDKLKELIRKFSVVRSLRMRLFIIFFVVGLVPCVILHYGILSNYESRAVEVRTEEVETHLRALANHLISYDYLTDQSSELIGAELAEFSALYDGRILVISDHLKVMKDTYSMSDGKTIVSPDVVKCLLQGNTGSTSNYDRRDGFIEIVTPIIETIYTDSRSDNEESSLDVSGEEVVKGVLGNTQPEGDAPGSDPDSGGFINFISSIHCSDEAVREAFRRDLRSQGRLFYRSHQGACVSGDRAYCGCV